MILDQLAKDQQEQITTQCKSKINFARLKARIRNKYKRNVSSRKSRTKLGGSTSNQTYTTRCFCIVTMTKTLQARYNANPNRALDNHDRAATRIENGR